MIHFSFLSPDDVNGITGLDPGEPIFLENPLGREFSLMRPSLLPGLLKSAAHHQNHKMNAVRAFELRSTFHGKGGDVLERKALAAVLSGPCLQSHWSTRAEETDFYDLKGVLEALLNLGVSDARFEESQVSYLHPRKQAVLRTGEKTLGLVGELHPDLTDKFDLKRTVYVFEIDWDGFAASAGQKICVFEDFSRTPVVERDLALILDEAVPAGALKAFLKARDEAVQDVSVFDLYRGNPIPAGKKSLAFSIRIGRKGSTLTDEEVTTIYDHLVDGVKKQFGADVR